MKKIQILVIMCALYIGGAVHAQQQISKREAANAATNALYNKADVLNRSSNTEIDTIHDFLNSRSNVLLYEVVFKNSAAILLSGSKACLPVLGYYIKPENDNRAIFDTVNAFVPPGLHALIQGFVREVEYCFSQNNIELYYENEWDKLQQSNLSRGDPPTTIIVAPLLTTRWDQQWSNDGDCPAYNYYVTEQNSRQCGDENCDDLCPVGCTAVAMGQIMKKWNYPVYLPNKVQQYDWCNMRDELLSYRPNYTKERNAIARLLKDCADNANSNYCIANCATSAFPNAAKNALVDDFGYSSNAKLRLQSSHSNSTWRNFIKTDLDNGRPVLYTIVAWIFNSHTLVCDGYGSDNLFHFNWGWGNSIYSEPDCWFALNALGDVKPGYGMRTHEAVFEIYPNINQDYCTYTYSLLQHFQSGGTHQNVPQTFANLVTVPEANNASWRTIASGTSATYAAHKSILIQSGFTAQAGSTFTAKIFSCLGCESGGRSGLFLNSNEDSNENIYFGNNNNEIFNAENNIQELPTITDTDFTVYPNPNDGNFTIKITGKIESYTLEIFNAMGVLIEKMNGYNEVVLVNRAGLPVGIYYVKMTIAEKVVVKKMVKQQ